MCLVDVCFCVCAYVCLQAGRVASISGSVLNLLVILMLSKVYTSLARLLTRWGESHLLSHPHLLWSLTFCLTLLFLSVSATKSLNVSAQTFREGRGGAEVKTSGAAAEVGWRWLVDLLGGVTTTKAGDDQNLLSVTQRIPAVRVGTAFSEVAVRPLVVL